MKLLIAIIAVLIVASPFYPPAQKLTQNMLEFAEQVGTDSYPLIESKLASIANK